MNVLAYQRKSAKGNAVVFLNMSASPQQVSVPGSGKVLVSSEGKKGPAALQSISLAPFETLIVEVQ
jgi:hypothetical protein